jgi:tRNA(fMet)-specific endonuclease VapC
MYVLDTDHMSLLYRATNIEAHRLRKRLNALLSDKDAATTIISFEEQIRGWMARIPKSRYLIEQVEVYRRLNEPLQRYCQIAVLDFDDRAAAQFGELQKQRLRLGTMDLKIAAIAIANNATLLSRNLKDFGKIPTLQVEDWAA